MNPDKKDDDGCPALCAALRVPDADMALRMVVELLQHNADVNARDADGNTALMLSCMTHAAARTPIIAALLRHPGVSLGARNSQGRTALMVAAVHGNQDALALLIAAFRNLQHHQQFGEVDSSGCSARQLAEHHGHQACAALLALQEEHSRPRANGFKHPPPAPFCLERPPTPPLDDTSRITNLSNKMQKFIAGGSHSMEQPFPESRKLRKQGIVTSISTDCLAAGPYNATACDSMPKISVASRSLNRSIHQLLRDDIEGRPGHRPPTPARQSLPNLMPVGHKSSHSYSSNSQAINNFNNENSASLKTTADASRGAYADMRRLTVSGAPRSASPDFIKRRSLEAIDIDLGASTRSEGWNAVSNHASGVVHLPPISKGKFEQGSRESKLILAKKTLEKLDNILSSEESLGPFNSRSSVHMRDAPEQCSIRTCRRKPLEDSL
ncbi:uncharacterized protein LOC108681631 [Hyalella azteca]|uniref:Uncharacterized protein LOC108681631 n=1 Tax=Hyalella azteca TaxID=294128 RepID=A0A979FM29_HYAAZ|nr:uncharacterized protein LOC108681631 [Hyalella azteca]